MRDDDLQMHACIPRLRRYARALVGNRAEADDLVQDTLERAWNKLSLWRGRSDLRAWLFSIMHNLHVDQVRKPKLSATSLTGEALVVPEHADQEGAMVVHDVDTALRSLPDDQREVLLRCRTAVRAQPQGINPGAVTALWGTMNPGNGE